MSTTVPIRPAAIPQPSVVRPVIHVAGDVSGNIVAGDNNFVVHTNYGTIVNQQSRGVQARAVVPLAPRPPRGFVGRTGELAQIERWIAGREPVYVYGAYGLGKTSLAKQAANEQLASSQGVLYVEGVDEKGQALSFGDMLQRMFDALFESEPHQKAETEVARTYLSHVRSLVLVSGSALTPLSLNRLPDIFSSARILVEGEQRPLGNAYQPLALGPLDPASAAVLLAQAASLALDEHNRPVVEECVRLLGLNPGALVIVGNLLREGNLRLQDLPSSLSTVAPLETDRDRAALERAYRIAFLTLSGPERDMLARAAAAAGLTVDASWFAGAEGEERKRKLAALGLVALLGPRVRLAPGLRTLALEGQDLDSLGKALMDHLGPQLRTRWLDFDFMREELGNLLGLLDWAAATSRWRHVVDLGRAMDPYLTLQGLWDAWGDALKHVRRASRALQDRSTEAWALHELGTRLIGKGAPGRARQLLTQARDLRLSLGDEVGAAYSQHNLDRLPPPPPAPPRGASRPRWPGGGGILYLLLGALAGLLSGVMGLGLIFLGDAGATSPNGTPVPAFSPTLAFSPTTAVTTPTFTPTAASTPTATGFASQPAADCLPPPGWIPVFVQPGQTFQAIAAQYNTTVDVLLQANCLAGPASPSGQRLYVPPAAAPVATGCPPPQGWVIYVVQPGDSLSIIAGRIPPATWPQLMAANCLQDTRIYAGQQLYVPYLPPAAAPTDTPSPTPSQAPCLFQLQVQSPCGQAPVTISPTSTWTPSPTSTSTLTATPADDVPPELYGGMAWDLLLYYGGCEPSEFRASVVASDGESGIDAVLLSYRLIAGNGYVGSWRDVLSAASDGDTYVFFVDVASEAASTFGDTAGYIEYYFVAWDRNGNKAVDPFIPLQDVQLSPCQLSADHRSDNRLSRNKW